MNDLKKELVFPTVVGVVTGLVLLLGGILVEQLRKPDPVPPAEIIYGQISTVVSKDDLSKRFPEKFNDEEENSVLYISTVFIRNNSGRSLKNLNFVVSSRIFRTPRWMDLDIDVSDAILESAIDANSIDSNGTLRFTISKFDKDADIEITFKSDDLAFFPELDTTNSNIKLRDVSIPQYVYAASTDKTGVRWDFVLALIGALLAAIGAYFATKQNGPPRNV